MDLAMDGALSRFAVLTRGCVECHTRQDLEKKLVSGRALRVKLGVDPTSTDLHLGHTVVFNRLRAFQDQGHTAVLIIGDFTARVGDPSGKDATRPALSSEAIRRNAETYREQAFKVLDPARTEMRYNSEWLEPFVHKELFGFLQRYSVGQLLQREDFALRQSKGQPISLLEILYPIFQGYDSIAVCADIELGGNDQLFNLLMGRQMQKDYGQQPQVALTFPLLVGTDGVRKMSKSYGNAIGLTDPPRELFGKIMRLSDELMMSYYELITQKDLALVRALHPMEAKRELAEELTARFYGTATAAVERGFFNKTFSQKVLPQLDAVTVDPAGRSWSRILVQIGAADSRKEAQRLIAAGGFKVDGNVVQEDELSALSDGRAVTLQIGKRKFYKVRFSSGGK